MPLVTADCFFKPNETIWDGLSAERARGWCRPASIVIIIKLFAPTCSWVWE